MARPTGWDILGLEGDPTPGVVESVQALAKEFGDFAHNVESAYHGLNSFGADANALQWIGQTADAFKGQFGPLPGRLQKLYTSYSEASEALSAYWPQLQAAQTKADAALRQAQDAHADLQRATTSATNAATDLKTAQQNQAANPNQKAVTDAQTAHDTAQTNLNNAKAKMAALTKQANDAYNDRINAAKACASSLSKAQGDGIHNKSWWDHVAEDLSKWGGEIGKIAGELAPILDIIALATSWIPGLDVVTAALAEIDNIVALAGTALATIGDAMQGHWGDALMGAGMLALTFVGGRALGSGAEDLEGEAGALEGEASAVEGGENAIGSETRTAEGNSEGVCETDPVDVVSGWMLTDETDLELPGVLPVVLRRAYSSGYAAGRLFGPGWSSTLDQRISINEAGIHFAGDDAQRLDYPVPAGTDEVLPERGNRWPLVWDRETDEIRVTDPWSGHTRHFAAVHYRDDSGQIRDLTAISDRNGNQIRILRDDLGTPTGIEHSAYRVAVDTAATASGPRVTGIRLLDGGEHGVSVKEYSYDDRGRLTGVTDSTAVPYVYEYDDANRIAAWIDRVGYRYTYEYDGLGRVVRTDGDDGYMVGTFDYRAAERTTVFTNSLGHTTAYRYDENGHISAATDPRGNTVVSEYDRFGRLLTRIDALGGRTVHEHDEQGDLLRVQGPDGSVTTLAYNRLHQVVEKRTPDGALWRREYDERGNMSAFVDPSGARSSYTYTAAGAIQTGVDALGNVTRFVADAAGLPVESVDPLGGTTHAERDAFGRTTAITDALGGVTRTGWSIEGRPLWRTAPDGARQTWQWDVEGRLLAHTDVLGGVTEFEPGPFGTVLARTDPNGDRFRFGHDAELRLLSVMNPAGATWQYEYDAAGRLAAETDFLGRRLGYEYDGANRLIRRTSGTGQETILERDAAGRVVSRQTADSQFSYTYDAAGRMVEAAGPDSSVTYVRDSAGRIVAETVDGRTLAYTYDPTGRRTGRQTPAGAVSAWSFDAAGRPVALDAGTGRLAFEHDGAGRETRRRLGGNAWLTNEFDGAGRLAAQRMWTGDMAQVVLDRTYAYRSDGAPTEIADSSRGTRRFQTDAAGRVTAVTGADWSETYAYDAFGNLAHASTPGRPDTVGDRVTDRTLTRRAGRTSYEHDAAGRLVRTVRRTLDGRRLVSEYTWNADDRLIRVELPDGAVWHYSYDPFGRRTGKHRSGPDGTVERYTFVWDGPRLAEQHTNAADGSVTALTWDYDPGSFRPAAQSRRSWAAGADQTRIDEAFHAIVTDLAGTPTELVGADGSVAWRTTTGLWGDTVATAAAPGVDCPLRFPGQYHDDETGLHYNLNRYYDPDTASYLSPDPLGLAPAPNDHAYVPNPLTWTDPLGLSCNPGEGITGAEAKAQALSDAGVPEGSEPLEVRDYVPSTTPAGKQILDENHNPVFFKEEDYLTESGDLVTYQDHYTGHSFGDADGVGDQPPHVHVRPYDDPRHGVIPGTQAHYYYDPSLAGRAN